MSNLTEEDKDISSEQETVKFLKKHRPPKFLTLGADYINHLRAVFDYRAWFSWESKPTKIDLPNIGDNTSGSLELEDTYSIEVQYENSTEIILKKLNEIKQGISVKGIDITHNPTENTFDVDFTQYNTPNKTVLVTIKKLIDAPVLEHILTNLTQFETVAPVKIKFISVVIDNTQPEPDNGGIFVTTPEDTPIINNPIPITVTPINTTPKKKYILGILGFKSLDDLNDTSKYYYIDKEANIRLTEIPSIEEQYISFNDYIAHGHKEIYLTLTDSLTNVDFNLKQFMPDLENFKFNIGLNQAQRNNHDYHLYSGFYGKNSGQLSISYENDFSWLGNEHGDRIIGLQGSNRTQWAEMRRDFYKTLSNDVIVANPAIRVTSDKVNIINLIGIKPIIYKGTKLHMLEKAEELNRPQSNPTYNLVYSPHAMYGNYAVISFKNDEVWDNNIDEYSISTGEVVSNIKITTEKIYGDNTFLEAKFIENIGNALISINNVGYI